MRRTLFAAAAVALLGVGCIPPPKQAGGLRFFDHEGLEHRMRMLCRLGVGDDEVKTACAVPEMRRRMAAEAEPPDGAPAVHAQTDDDEASKSCSGAEKEGTLAP